MKTDAIEFDTRKTLLEIQNVLRSQKCEIEKLKEDPFGNANEIKPAIAVLLQGRDGLFNSGTEWGVQVIVTELGNKRHVEMIALGESGVKQAFRAYASTGGRTGIGTGYWSEAKNYCNFGSSKRHRDKIASALS